MPVIGQNTFILAPSPDKYVSLANEEFVRRISFTGFGDSWTRMRLALNYAIAETGGGTVPNASLFLGLCSGTTFPYQSQSCVNAVGIVWGAVDSSTAYTYNAGGGNPYYSSPNFNCLRKVGQGVLSSSVGPGTWALPTTGGALQRRGWLGVTLTKTSATQVTLTGFTEAVATAASDVFYEHSVYATNQAGTPVVLNTTAAASSPNTLAPGAGWSTTNPLDSINVFWSNATYALRIYALSCAFTN